MKHRILIVEDNVMLAGQQKRWLEKSGYGVSTTIDEPGARKRIKSEHFDLVLADVRLPEGNGISLLEWLRKEKIDIPFIVMTGYASVPDAVRAIKLGADDYLAKPVQMDELLELIKDILQPSSRIYDRDRNLFRRNSPQMLEVENLARTVAPFDISVLILGPNGAGKESVAQRIHYSSNRKEKPLVAVNCAVLPKELAPTLFFGHMKGTFTGADSNKDGYFDLAKGGTLFLDEIGTLSPEVQAMLLRVLQEGTYLPIGSSRERKADVRIVAATNEDLQSAIKERRFREDLYHRLGEFEITEGFSPEAGRLMLSYRWPGNVRELQNKIKRAVLMARQPVIEAAELNIRQEETDGGINLFPETEAEEKQSILKALTASGGHRRKAAEMLHVDPSTLYRKMKKYGLLDR